jgi:hypothetical protein
VSATTRVAAFLTLLAVGDGASVGNRPAALPPGVRLGLGVGTSGRLPTGSGDVVAAGMTGPEIATAALASGSFGSLAALPMTVRLTDVTVEVAATVT